MSENENTDKDLEKIDHDINSHRELVIFLIVVVILAYLAIATNQFSISESLEKWGTFGDFFGGILNPIFGLFAFYWLTYSVRLQIKELKETRKELKKAAKAQEESAKHQKSIADLEQQNVKTQKEILELQEKTLFSQQFSNESKKKQNEIQNFESLFFELLKSKNNMLNDINFSNKFFPDEDYFRDEKIYIGKEAFREGIIYFKNNYSNESWKDYFNNYLKVHWSTYFNLCFHIVNVIDKSDLIRDIEPRNMLFSNKQREYFEIFKVTFTQYELEVVFFLLLFDTKYQLLKNKFEKYSAFTFLDIDHKRYEAKLNKLSGVAYLYDKRVFGNNENWGIYFNEIKFIRLDLEDRIAKKIANLLVKVGYLTPINTFNSFIKIKFSLINSYENNFNAREFKFKNINSAYNEVFLKKHLNTPYSNLVNQINSIRLRIKNVNKAIKTIKGNCIANSQPFGIDDKYHIEGFNSYYVPREMYNEINKSKKEISQVKEKIKELDLIFERLNESEYLESVLILMKYQINYSKYKTYFSQ